GVLGKGEVARGHELCLADGARPGARYCRLVDVAALEDLEGGEELALEERLASALPGQRGERLHNRTHAAEPAEVRFHAPDGHDEPWLHVIARGDTREHRPVRRKAGGGGPDERPREAALHVLLEREDGSRLGPVAFDD